MSDPGEDDDYFDMLNDECEPCAHDEYEIDILTGRATCDACGNVWNATAEAIAAVDAKLGAYAEGRRLRKILAEELLKLGLDDRCLATGHGADIDTDFATAALAAMRRAVVQAECRHGNECIECFYVSHPGDSA